MAKICDAVLRADVAEVPSAECIDCGALWAKGPDVDVEVVSHIEQTSHSVVVDRNHRELWGMA